MWCIPPKANAEFVWKMEDVLEVYKRPYDPLRPVVCMDETSKQLIAETRPPEEPAPGRARRVDYEYERKGVADLFMFFEPLRGWRRVWIAPQRRKVEWAWCVKRLLGEHYPQAERLVLVCDNLNTHTGGALYEAFPAAEARRLWERLEVHYTPEARQLAEHSGDGVERPLRPMPRPSHRRSRGVAARSRGVGGGSKPSGGEGPLAVHDRKRPDQVGETLSGPGVSRARAELVKTRVTPVVYV
jgi:hypothetical protein